MPKTVRDLNNLFNGSMLRQTKTTVDEVVDSALAGHRVLSSRVGQGMRVISIVSDAEFGSDIDSLVTTLKTFVGHRTIAEQNLFFSKLYTETAEILESEDSSNIAQIVNHLESAAAHKKIAIEASTVPSVAEPVPASKVDRETSISPTRFGSGPNSLGMMVSEEEGFAVSSSFSKRSDRSLVASDSVCIMQPPEPAAQLASPSDTYILFALCMAVGSVISLVMITFLQSIFSIFKTILNNVKNRLN